MGRCLLVTAVLLLVAGCLVAVPALATPFWSLHQGNASGAIFSCLAASSFSLSQCQLYSAPSASDIVLLVVALAMISGLFFLVATILGLVLLCKLTHHLKIATIVFALLAAALLVADLVIFAVRLPRFAPGADVSTLHFSYWMAAVGAGLEVLGALLLLCVRPPQDKVTPDSAATFTRMTRSEERERAEALFVKMYSDFLRKHPSSSLAAVAEFQQSESTRAPGASMHPPTLSGTSTHPPKARPPSPRKPPSPSLGAAAQAQVSRGARVQEQVFSRARSVVTEPIHDLSANNSRGSRRGGPNINGGGMDVAARRYSHPQQQQQPPTQQQRYYYYLQQKQQGSAQAPLPRAPQHSQPPIRQHEVESRHHSHHSHQRLYREPPEQYPHQHQQQQAEQAWARTVEKGAGEGGDAGRRRRRGSGVQNIPPSIPGFPGVAAPGTLIPSSPAVARGRGKVSHAPQPQAQAQSQSRPYVPRLQLPGSLSDEEEEAAKRRNFNYQPF